MKIHSETEMSGAERIKRKEDERPNSLGDQAAVGPLCDIRLAVRPGLGSGMSMRHGSPPVVGMHARCMATLEGGLLCTLV